MPAAASREAHTMQRDYSQETNKGRRSRENVRGAIVSLFQLFQKSRSTTSNNKQHSAISRHWRHSVACAFCSSLISRSMALAEGLSAGATDAKMLLSDVSGSETSSLSRGSRFTAQSVRSLTAPLMKDAA